MSLIPAWQCDACPVTVPWEDMRADLMPDNWNRITIQVFSDTGEPLREAITLSVCGKHASDNLGKVIGKALR